MLEGTDSLADATHLIIDEVHERSIDSDFLLIVLKEILEVRKDLKFVLTFSLIVLSLMSLMIQSHSDVSYRRVSIFRLVQNDS